MVNCLTPSDLSNRAISADREEAAVSSMFGFPNQISTAEQCKQSKILFYELGPRRCFSFQISIEKWTDLTFFP